MIIPNFQNIKFVEQKTGYLTADWQNLFQELITALQKNLSDEGFHIPQQSATNIAQLQTRFAASATPSVYWGTMLYDTTNDVLKVFLNDNTFHTVTTV